MLRLGWCIGSLPSGIALRNYFLNVVGYLEGYWVIHIYLLIPEDNFPEVPSGQPPEEVSQQQAQVEGNH